MEVPRHWRLRKQRYRLAGDICDNCETPMFLLRPICPECGMKPHGEIKIEDLKGDVFASDEALTPVEVISSLPMEASMSSR